MLFVMLGLVILLRFLAARGGYVSIYDQPYHPMNTWWGFVASVFLVHAWNILPSLTWNGASWFVSVEFLLCPAVPDLSHLVARRRAARRAVDRGRPRHALTYLARTSTDTASTSPSTTASSEARPASRSAWASRFIHREAIARGWGALPDGLFSFAQLAAVLLLLDAIYRTRNGRTSRRTSMLRRRWRR